MTRIALDDPRFYLNRHLQWMAFNQRVLEEARDATNPLLERVKFLAITANNLIVRGQCTLVPGLRGVSSRIRVRSIVGRFLEHSRIFQFEHGGRPEVYLGSADWMPRNLYQRVEVLFPVKDEQIRERICKEILPAYLSDNRKARLLGPEGLYTHSRRSRNGKGFSAQDHLMSQALGGVNSSAQSRERQAKIAYTRSQEVTAPLEPAVTPELETEDSSNAAV